MTEPTAPFGLLDVRGDGTGVARGAACRWTPSWPRGCGSRPGAAGCQSGDAVPPGVGAGAGGGRGRDDVVFGTVLFGRMNAGAGRGPGAGPVHQHAAGAGRGSAAPSAAEAVAGMRRQLAGLLAHEHAPLALAQQASGVAAPAPLFTSLFNYRHSQAAARPRRRAGLDGSRGAVRGSAPTTR